MPNNPQELFDEIIDIVKNGTEPYREELNKRTHIIDISYEALRQSAPYLTKNQYASLISYFQRRFTTTAASSLEEVVTDIYNYKERTKRGLRVRIYYTSEEEAYLIASSYPSLQASLSRALKQAEQLPEFKNIGASLSVFIGTDQGGKTVVNVGHIQGKESVILGDLKTTLSPAISPLGYQVSRVLGRLPKETAVARQVQGLLDRLVRLHTAKITYSLDRKDAFSNRELAKNVVLVTLQSADKNNEFSVTEKKISNRLKKLFQDPKVIQMVLKAKGSNNIIEDITEVIMSGFGKSRTSGSKHTKKSPKTQQVNLSPSKTIPIERVPRSSIRTVSGQFYSLASLQTLLDGSLIDRVKQNMGKGNRRDILNLRSGRFAESVKVEKLSQSREGMITAFYSYMKNPYATFSQGGRQSSPKTRDPKLLIARSIREIAASVVSNRMRSVPV